MRRPRNRNFSMEQVYADVRASMSAGIHVKVCKNLYFSNGLIQRFLDAVRARIKQGQVNHVTGDVHYLTYFLPKRRTILTIHDCVTLERISGLKHWIFWLLWYWLPERRASVVVTVSETSKKRLLHYLRCNPSKIQVIHNPVSDVFQPKRPEPLNGRKFRFLHVGTKENKNLERHVTALAGLNCTLSIVGALSSEQRACLETFVIDYENHVGLSQEMLVEEYQRCDALLFASTYEGFGLPIVEAQAVGRPVITSNLWSMPEAAGEGACLVDPCSVESIRQGVIRVFEDASYRESLVQNGFENVKRFKASEIAEQYAELYRRVAKN